MPIRLISTRHSQYYTVAASHLLPHKTTNQIQYRRFPSAPRRQLHPLRPPGIGAVSASHGKDPFLRSLYPASFSPHGGKKLLPYPASVHGESVWLRAGKVAVRPFHLPSAPSPRTALCEALSHIRPFRPQRPAPAPPTSFLPRSAPKSAKPGKAARKSPWAQSHK